MKKKLLTLTAAAAMTLAMTMTAFAGQWLSDANGWWYQNDNGTYPVNTWQWIDGNNDGVAESFYFNEQGYCLMNTTTPDGYTVNPTGAWIVDGVVQTQQVAAAAASQAQPASNVEPVNLLDLEPVTSSEYWVENDVRTVQNKLWSKAIGLGNSSSYTTKVEYYTNGQYNQLYLGSIAFNKIRYNEDAEYSLEIYGDDDELLDSIDNLDYKSEIDDYVVDISGQNYVSIYMVETDGGWCYSRLLIKNAQFR